MRLCPVRFLFHRSETRALDRRKESVNFLEKASKNRVPVAYAVRGFFRGDTAQNTKFCRIKWGGVLTGKKVLNFLKKVWCKSTLNADKG